MAMLVTTRGYIQILLPCRPVHCKHLQKLWNLNHLFGKFIAKYAALNRSPFLVLKLKVPKHPQTVIPRIDSRRGFGKITNFIETHHLWSMSHRIHVWYIYIYTNIGGILMGSMLPYIAAPWIRHGFMKDVRLISSFNHNISGLPLEFSVGLAVPRF